MRCTRSRVSAKGSATTVAIEVPDCGAGSACGETPPNNAPSPRPNAGFDMPRECRRTGELSKKFSKRDGDSATQLNRKKHSARLALDFIIVILIFLAISTPTGSD